MNIVDIDWHGGDGLEPMLAGLFQLPTPQKCIITFSNHTVLHCSFKKEFVTDGGSVPRLARRWVPHIGCPELLRCYKVHDGLFSTQGHLHDHTFGFTNWLFEEMLKFYGDEIEKKTGIGPWRRRGILWAVDSYWGRKAWDDYDKWDDFNVTNETCSCTLIPTIPPRWSP